MRRLRGFPMDELLFAQLVPGFLLCTGWSVMYEIYHEDGSYYTTLMQEILGGDGLFPYFLVSAILMALPVGMVIDAVREVVAERWLGLPRARSAGRAEPLALQAIVRPVLPLARFEDRCALYRHIRAVVLTPARAAGNIALVLAILLAWFVVKIIRMQGWHVFSLAFIIATPVIGTVIAVALYLRYAAGLADYRRLMGEAMAIPGAPGGTAAPEDAEPPLA